MKWQTPETAPLHREVLVYRDDAGVLLGIKTSLDNSLFDEDRQDAADIFLSEEEWYENVWWSYSQYGILRMEDDGGNPTHWMPLPEPPNNLLDRKTVLLQAAFDLLMKQYESDVVLNLLEETVIYDEADVENGQGCDGLTLMEDIATYFTDKQ